MSTELGVSPVLEEAQISLTQFFGGVERGVCVQVTQPQTERTGGQFIQLTATEARDLGRALITWADSQD